MTGVWGGFSVETEDSSSDLSRGPGPEDAQTVEVCWLNFHDLHALHTARFVFRNIELERTDMWKIMILIMFYGGNKSKVIWSYKQTYKAFKWQVIVNLKITDLTFVVTTVCYYLEYVNNYIPSGYIQ